MRKLIFAINVTLDWCCDHTRCNPDKEVHEYFARLTRESGVLVYGRKTYQLMVPYWPDIAKNNSGQTKTSNDFAQAFVSVSQILVFSQSLDKAESENTRIVRGNLKHEIIELKRQPGKDILTGGVSLPSQLMELGLVDEIRWVVHPIVTGEGRRLFDDIHLREKFEFKLLESTAFKSGSVALRYSKQ